MSVIIPTYNRKALLFDAVSSCLHQTFKDLEIIVVDDGSTDGTAEFVSKSFDEAWRYKKITYIRQDNRGASAARNRGLQVSQGDYIQFLDSDDLLAPTKLAKQISELEIPTNVDAVCCYCLGTMGTSVEKNAPKEKIGFSRLYSPASLVGKLASHIVHGLPTPSPLWRRSFLIEHAGWREDISLGDDLEYYVRLISGAKKVCYVDEQLFFVRDHAGPRLSAVQISTTSLQSMIRTRQAIFTTLEQAGLWNSQNQQGFLKVMRTIYANALQLNEPEAIRGLEDWLWRLLASSRRNHQFYALILLRRTFGSRLLLGAYKFLKSLRPA